MRASRPPLLLAILSILVFASLVSCGGGSVEVRGTIVFPTEGMNFAEGQITVLGLGSEGTEAVLVNGVPATSDDGFRSWRAPLALAPGVNPIRVGVAKGGLVLPLGEVRVTQGPELLAIQTCSDQVGDVFLVFDPRRQELVRVDRAEGSRLHHAYPGASPRRIVYDAASERAICLSLGEVVVIDLLTGSSTIMNAPLAHDMAFDPAADRVFLNVAGSAAQQIPSVVEVMDLATGQVTTWSGALPDLMAAANYLVSLDFDPVTNTLYAAGATARDLYALPPGGNRVLLSADPDPPPATTVSGVVIPGQSLIVGSVLLDEGRRICLVETQNVFTEIDFLSGQRRRSAAPSVRETLIASRDRDDRLLLGSGQISLYSGPAGGARPEWTTLRSIDLDTLAVEPFFALSPVGALSSQLSFGSFGTGSLGFDARRGELILGGGTSMGRLDPVTRRVAEIAIPVQGNSANLRLRDVIGDDENDRILAVLEDQLASPDASGLFAIAPDGSTATRLHAYAIPTTAPLHFETWFEHDPESAGFLRCSQRYASPTATDAALSVERFAPDGTPLDDLSIAIYPRIVAPPVWDPVRKELLVAAMRPNGIDTELRAIDLRLGFWSLLSAPDGGTLTSLRSPAAGRSPRTGEVLFAVAGTIVAVDPGTGSRRVLVDLGARLDVSSTSAMTSDPRTGVLHFISWTGTGGRLLISVEPDTGAAALLAR